MPSRRSIPHPHSKSNADVLMVADRLHSAAIHLLRRVRQQDVATGEGPARLSALSVLVFGGPKTLGELAAAEQVKPPTMTRIAAGLARSQLAEITPDPDDARRMQIRATPKGTSLLQQARERRIADLASQLNQLPSAQLATLGDAVEILRTMLQKWC
ncbi:MAG TPA: MarR family transcriptional regulator [Candidatus Sulfotelmatobacter sp.]|nr:MarR family transcriptional regulator [Candidatus Sulfotelmatobacter sp.]